MFIVVCTELFSNFSISCISKKKVTLSKRELIELAAEKDVLPPDTDPKSFSKSELLSMIDEQPDPAAVSTSKHGCYELKLEGFRLSPTAMTSSQTTLTVADGSSHSLWKIVLVTGSQNRLKAQTITMLCNTPSPVRYVACNTDSIFVTSRAGLHEYRTDLKLVVERDGLLGVCASQSMVAVSCKNGVVYPFSDGTLLPLSGREQERDLVVSTDGFSLNAMHAQPGPLCMEYKSLVVCDMASLQVRLVTSVRPLLDYHATISTLYEAFAIHSDKIGFRATLPLDVIISKLSDHCSYLHSIVEGIRVFTENPTLKPNGPQGCVPYTTVTMMSDLLENLKDLHNVIQTNNETYACHPAALLSTPCEHHFATMRSRYQMPTLLQYCDHLDVVVAEHLKRATTTYFKYFTKKESYYPNPDFQKIDISKVTLETQERGKSSSKQLSKEDRQLMLNWRLDFCAGNKTLTQL